MRVKSVVLATLLSAAAGLASAQMLGELDAAQAGQNQLNQGSVTGGLDAGGLQNRANNAAQQANGLPALPGTGTNLPNPTGGFAPPAAGPLPGLPGDPSLGAPPIAGPDGAVGDPALGQPGLYAPQGQQGAAPTPTPIPTIEVLTGKRVFCAVCGTMLEDAYKVRVYETDMNSYADDGLVDNGVAGDGLRGNVETIKDKYVGASCHEIRTRLINAVRGAEDMRPPSMIGQYEESPYYLEDPDSRQKRMEAQLRQQAQEESTMHFFRYHVATIDPTDKSGMPYLVKQEEQRDNYLAEWNNRFLAKFRMKSEDPQSEYYPLYIPQPPLPPTRTLPPGYVSPQQMRKGTQPGQLGAGAAGPNIFNGDPVI